MPFHPGAHVTPLVSENKPLASLRGIAALYVVFHHVGLISLVALHQVDCVRPVCNAIWPGFTAVDAFFVLSGYILTNVYGDLRGNGVVPFLVKRVFRIYPLHLAVLGLLLVGAAYTGEAIPWADLPSIALMTHIWTLKEPSWSPQSWSMAVELVCYALFPAALMLLRSVRLPTRTLPALWSLALVAALGVLEYGVQEHFLGAALGWPAVLRSLVAFALGMALCQLSLALPRLSRSVATLGEVASLAGLVVCALNKALLPMPLFWAGLIFFLAPDTGWVARALHARPLVWIGHISFSIYLLHMVVLDGFLRWLMPGILFTATLPHVVLWGLAQVVVVLALSHLTWRFIEEPGRRLPRQLGLGRVRVAHALTR